MSLDWYLVISALIFSIGAAGVLTRRNPLVVLLCLELMLNAANIALIAYARMWGNIEGQVFAISPFAPGGIVVPDLIEAKKL